MLQNAAPAPRKLFWRYKANWQRTVRDGDFKYLKILDNIFLFNVVDDPMDRANLKTMERCNAAGGRGKQHPRLLR